MTSKGPCEGARGFEQRISGDPLFLTLQQEVTIKFDVEEDEEGEKVRRASIKGLLKKDTEEPVLPVTFRELLSLNAPDWPFVVVGVLFSFVQGTFFPVISVLFSNILRVWNCVC